MKKNYKEPKIKPHKLVGTDVLAGNSVEEASLQGGSVKGGRWRVNNTNALNEDSWE